MLPLHELAVGLALLLAQPAQTPSITVDPTSPQATNVHWTVTLSAPYCGGFRIGDGVYLQPEPPLALPADVPADGVLFNGQAADVALQDGVLRVAPSHGLAQSMVCQTGARQFTVELLGSLGLTNPDIGDYAVDVRLGAGGVPQQLPITISAPPTACTPIQQQVDAATATLLTDNAALAKTFDAIRAQTPQDSALTSAQADLLHQLDGVQTTATAMAADGWNPDVAYAAQASDWAQGPAQADLTALQNAASQPGVKNVIPLVQTAQQQAQDGIIATQKFQDVLMQLADCGLGTPPAP